MSRDIIYIIIILLLSVAVWILWDRSKTDSLKADLKVSTAQIALEESEKARQAEITRADSISWAEARLRQENDRKSAERDRGFKSTVARLNQNIEALKAERSAAGVAVDPITAAVESKYDSLNKAQTAEIATLQVDMSAAAASFTREITALESKWTAERETSLKKDDLILKQGNQIEVLGKKNKRLSKTVKIIGTVLFAETVYLAIEFFKPD